MHNLRKVSIIAVVLIAIGLVGGILTYAFTDTGAITLERTVDASPVSHIEIETRNESIMIRPSHEGSEIRVEYNGREISDDDLKVEVTDDTLTIRTKHKFQFFNINFLDIASSLTIYLPVKDYASVQVKNKNGRVDIQELTVQDMSTKTSNGRIELDAVNADTVSVSSSNGRISMNHVEGDITGKTSNGAIYLRTASLDRDINLETSNGSIEVDADEKPTNVVYDLKTSNGKISVFGSSDWDIMVGDGDHVVKLATSNGRITIK